MSERRVYSEEDEKKFAELTSHSPSRSKPATSSGKQKTNGDAAQVYSQSDLDKFQKMFGEGFTAKPRRPGENIQLSRSDKSSRLSKTTHESRDRAPASVARKASSTPGKKGRVSEQKPAGLYREKDLKKFEALESQAQKSARDAKPAGSRSQASSNTTSSQRSWRFPELHDSERSVLDLSSSESKSERRIRLSYFD